MGTLSGGIIAEGDERLKSLLRAMMKIIETGQVLQTDQVHP
jgi:hypothetical protein